MLFAIVVVIVFNALDLKSGNQGLDTSSVINKLCALSYEVSWPY